MLDDLIKSEIKLLFNANPAGRTWLFDEAPQRQKNNSLTRFGYRITDCENIILIHDSTTFRTGKEGIILTDKMLYWKEIAQGPRSLPLSNVLGFKWRGVLIGMQIETDHPSDNFQIITEHGKILSVLLNALLPVVSRDIESNNMASKLNIPISNSLDLGYSDTTSPTLLNGEPVT